MLCSTVMFFMQSFFAAACFICFGVSPTIAHRELVGLNKGSLFLLLLALFVLEAHRELVGLLRDFIKGLMGISLRKKVRGKRPCLIDSLIAWIWLKLWPFPSSQVFDRFFDSSIMCDS